MSEVRTSVYWSIAARYTGLVSHFVSTVVLTRLLTPEEIGLFSVSMACILVASTVREFGVANFIIQAPEASESMLRRSQAVALTIGWTLAAVIWFGRGAVADFYSEPGVARVMAVLAVTFLLMPIGLVARAVVVRELRFKSLAAVQVPMAVMQGAVSITCAYYGGSYMSMAWGQLASQITAVIGFILLRPRLVFLVPSFNTWLPLMKFGAYTSAAACMAQLGVYLPEIIMGRLISFSAVGYYARATSLVGLYEAGIGAVVMPIALAAFAAARNESRNVSSAFLHGFTLLSAFGIPFFGVLGVLAQPIVLLLYGENWLPTVPILQLLCVALPVSTFTGLAAQAMVAFGAVRENLIRISIVQMANVALVTAASLHSVEAVAATQLLSGLLNAVLSMYVLRRLLALRAMDVFLSLTGSLTVTAAAMTGAAAMSLVAEAQTDVAAVQVVLGGIGAAAGWFVAVFLLDHPVRPEVQRVLRHAVE